jgi:two-component system OmpR family sensor kinase
VTLRRRLTLAMAALMVLGLAVAGFFTFTAVRSFLFGRVDEQVETGQVQAYAYLTSAEAHSRPPTVAGLQSHVSPDVYVVVLDAHGTPVIAKPSGPLSKPDPFPIIPRTMPVASGPTATTFGGSQGAFRPSDSTESLGAKGASGTAYRAEAVKVPQGTLVTAVGVAPTNATLSSLLRIELICSGAVVLALCVVASLIIRRGLRPLEDISRTAGAVSRGDLAQRLPEGDDLSEVGRLRGALNAMLGQIEAGFAEKSASEAKLRQFVADASHELRTPLTSIRGYAELLRKGAFTDEQSRRRALERVESESARMGVLVDDLLLLARLDQGAHMDRGPVDVGEVFAEAVEDARALAPERPLTFDADPEVVVMGDPARLGQVAHNLVRNALMHTPAATAVGVEVRREGLWARARVIDHGPGLDTDRAGRIFDRFYRGDASRTGGGTGLGLAIVRAITERTGGSVQVETTPGGGATFVVRLPLLARAQPVPEREPADAKPGSVGAGRQGPRDRLSAV